MRHDGLETPLPVKPLQRSRKIGIVAFAATLSVFAASCGRSSSSTPSGPSSSSSTQPSTSGSATAAGEFGTLKKVCAPGPGTGGSGRGINGKTINIGVLGDPGAAAAPGLGQEFFDVADGFAKWCNAAGGINGRTIKVDLLDAKLFNGAAEVIQACQKDFMLVGGGQALDANTVKPRLACKLGQIPAYTASPQNTDSGLQVTPVASRASKYPVGPLRLLAAAFPETKQGLGIAGSSLASLTPQGLRAQEAWTRLGYKVSTVQPRPALVDNYRPYLEQMKQVRAKADFEIVAQDPSPIFQAMLDTGFKPQWVLFGQTFYSPKSVAAAKVAAYVPNSFVDLSNLPWEMADQFPVVKQAIGIMAAGPGTKGLDSFTSLAFNSWTLWAQSATACGTNLTQDCVLQKAAAHPAWDAGGLFPPVNTDPKAQDFTNCVLLMNLTKNGWVYDKKATQPNNGVYNCGADNLMSVKSYGG
jgi:hypothetical protein